MQWLAKLAIQFALWALHNPQKAEEGALLAHKFIEDIKKAKAAK